MRVRGPNSNDTHSALNERKQDQVLLEKSKQQGSKHIMFSCPRSKIKKVSSFILGIKVMKKGKIRRPFPFFEMPFHHLEKKRTVKTYRQSFDGSPKVPSHPPTKAISFSHANSSPFSPKRTPGSGRGVCAQLVQDKIFPLHSSSVTQDGLVICCGRTVVRFLRLAIRILNWILL